MKADKGMSEAMQAKSIQIWFRDEGVDLIPLDFNPNDKAIPSVGEYQAI